MSVRSPGTARLVQRAHEQRSARYTKIPVRGLAILPARITELQYRAVPISSLVTKKKLRSRCHSIACLQ